MCNGSVVSYSLFHMNCAVTDPQEFSVGIKESCYILIPAIFTIGYIADHHCQVYAGFFFFFFVVVLFFKPRFFYFFLSH